MVSLCIVLPTRVGMVRHSPKRHSDVERAPHPRGDGPVLTSSQIGNGGCSPPAWGWSVIGQPLENENAVLPTRVGMVRQDASSDVSPHSAPHPRGDGPTSWYPRISNGQCSPPAWGWSDFTRLLNPGDAVLPTRVGMVRFPLMRNASVDCAPHPRGDGPLM